MYRACGTKLRNFLNRELGNQGKSNTCTHECTNVHSCNQLTWHNGAIPSDQIWVKLGGDKGGGTFKMHFQICNVCQPNSPSNTCIFCIFMAYDSVTNLHIGLDRYVDQIKDLQEKKWR